MRRRDFLSVIAGATTWSLAARAQAMPVIGFLNPAPAAEAIPHLVAAFRHGLADDGYAEGKNVAIEYRFTGSKSELMQEAAADLVRRNVNAIFASTPQAVAVMARKITTIPVVALDLESDPLAMGYVNSLARPGRNMTGMFLDLPELGLWCKAPLSHSTMW